MRYITIDPATLQISATEQKPPAAIVVPSKFIPGIEQPILTDLVYGALYLSVFRDDRRKGDYATSYRLCGPDPWLVALAAIMWEGIVQGLSYDLVKTYVTAGLEELRTLKLAPKKNRDLKTRKTEVHFIWTEFSNDGHKRRQLYLDLKREYERMPIEKRSAVTKSLRSAGGRKRKLKTESRKRLKKSTKL